MEHMSLRLTKHLRNPAGLRDLPTPEAVYQTAEAPTTPKVKVSFTAKDLPQGGIGMSKPQILIVEDEGIVANDIQRRVTKMGFDVPRISSTAEDAITQAMRFLPNLVLMDINLKGSGEGEGVLDGVTAAQTIRSNLDIPVVFLTAHAEEDTLNRAKASQPYGFLLKPFKEAELRMTIHLALQNHSFAKRLADDQTRIASTLSNIADGVICVGANGAVLTMNPAAESLTGSSEAEAEHRSIGQLLHVEEETISRLTSEAKDGCSSPGRYFLGLRKSNDGAAVPTEIHVVPLRTWEREPNNSVIVIREVKSRSSRDAVFEAEDRASVLVQAFPDAIFRLDRFGTVSDARLRGADSAVGGDLLGTNLYTSVDQILTAIQRALEKSEVQTLEFALPSSTGLQRRWVHIVPRASEEAVMPMRDSTTLGFPEVLSHVAVRGLMNKEMQTLSESLEEAMCNPLLTVGRICHHLTAQFDSQLGIEGRACVRLLKETSGLVRDRMEDVIFYMRLKALPVEKTHVNLQKLALEVCTEVSRRYAARRAKVSVDLLPDCFGCEPLLRRLLSALLDNAFQFSRRQGCIQVGFQRATAGISYFVRDNGSGFDNRDSNQIFDAFERLHRGVQYTGVGLGLSIAQRIIERHGGEIWADGKVGKGALFSFTLPDK
jgi:PAS domain S-box-containing protein